MESAKGVTISVRTARRLSSGGLQVSEHGRRQRARRIRLAQTPVCLFRHPCCDNPLERTIIHEANEYLLILVHALHKQPLQEIAKYELEFVFRVCSRCLAKSIVGDSYFYKLVEEELVSLIEIGAKSLVDNVDEPRKRYILSSH